MCTPRLSGFLLLVVCVLPAFTQVGRNRALGDADSFATPSTAVFLSGKVTVDGTDLTEPAAIQVICQGQRHIEAYTNGRGRFSFQFADVSAGIGAGVSDASTSMMMRASSAQELRDWQYCELQAVLAGYSSEPIEFTSRMASLQSTDFGRVALRRTQHVEGTSISVTGALAPAAAQKALEKGRDEATKGKWDKAQAAFEKAVQIYPKYAAAWNELGRVQMHRNDGASAEYSFKQALAADPKYVNPYIGLAQLASQARQWGEVRDVTDKLLALNPVDFPEAYFLNGVANYNLQHAEAAEKRARQGIQVDHDQRVPELHFLLGAILERKRDYQQASEQVQTYLKLARSPAEIDAARKKLAEIRRLSANPDSVEVDSKRQSTGEGGAADHTSADGERCQQGCATNKAVF